MTQVVEPGTGGSAFETQPVEVLVPEVRQRTRRRRLRNLAVVLLLVAVGAITYGIVGRGPTLPSGSSASGPGAGVGSLPSSVRSAAVAMSTQTLSDGRGSVTTYYSGTGTMMVQTHRSASGVIQSIQRVVWRVVGDRLTTTYTTVFPTESSWASSFSAGLGSCSPMPCYADAYLYASPPFVQRLLTKHEAVLSKQVTQMNGRSVVELVFPLQSTGSISSGPSSVLWVDPTNYEVVRQLLGSNAPPSTALNFSWLPNTTSDLSHLLLSIPNGYSKIDGKYGSGLLPTPPPIFSSYQAALLSCANQTSTVSSLPDGTKFIAVKSGTVEGTPWTLWFANADHQIVYALMSGGGSAATCISTLGDTGGSAPWDASPYNAQVVQFPGQPVAFVIGYVTDAAVNSFQVSLPSRSNVDAAFSPLPSSVTSSAARLIFAELSGLSCAAIKQFGFWVDYTVSAGTTSLGGSNSSPDFGATCAS